MHQQQPTHLNPSAAGETPPNNPGLFSILKRASSNAVTIKEDKEQRQMLKEPLLEKGRVKITQKEEGGVRMNELLDEEK